VPRFEELSLKRVYKAIVDKYPTVEVYMNTYGEALPPRSFFWNVFNTLESEVCNKIIDEAFKTRCPNPDTNPSEMILISDEILSQIQGAAFVSSKCHI